MKLKIYFFFFSLSMFYNGLLHAQTPKNINNLRGWWAFNGNTKDSSGFKNNGMGYNIKYTKDRHNNPNAAILFNGTNSVVKLDSTYFSGQNKDKFTFAFWIKTSDMPSVGAYTILHKDGFWRMVNINVDLSKKCISLVGSYPNPQQYWGGSSKNGSFGKDTNWHHWAFTFSQGKITMYLDGKKDTSFNTRNSVDFSYLAAGNSNSVNYIGTSNSVSNGDHNYFKGALDDLAYWDNSLDSSQISYLNEIPKKDTVFVTIRDTVYYCDPNKSCNLNSSLKGLIRYYKLDSTFNDFSGNLKHSTDFKNIKFTSNECNQKDKAAYFGGDSAQSYIRTPQASTIPTDFTYSLKFKTNKPTKSNYDLLNYRSSFNSSGNWDRSLMMDTVGKLQFYVFPGSQKLITSKNKFGDNKWHRVTAILSSKTGMKLYVDGKLEAQDTAVKSGQNSTGYWLIGFHGHSLGSGHYKGFMDEIGIWNRALDSNEIKSVGSAVNYVNDTIRTIIYDTIRTTIYDTISVQDTLIINAKLSNTTPQDYNVIKAYPNPVKDHLIIDFGNYQSMLGYEVNIFDLAGKSVYSTSVNQKIFTIDLKTWSGPGSYILRIYDKSNSVISAKIIIVN